MTTFDKAFEYAMKWEGGATLTDDPKDPGGKTKYGIAQHSHPGMDIENLTEEKAKVIYALEYWGGINGNEVAKRSERIAIKLFDMAVNLGSYRATRIFQAALNDCTRVDPKLVEDGRLGNACLMALEQIGVEELLAFLIIRLEKHYQGIGNERFMKGWMRRARAEP